jgi:hypothetical protein
MGSTTTVLLVGIVIGYLIIEHTFVIPPKFLPIYILLSAIMVMMTI